jgi:polyferredoxin
MEFVYRPLERLFLGKAYANPKAGVSAWRRAGMYAAYLVVSAHLANTLLAWFVGADRLTGWIFTSTPASHPVAFFVFALVTAAMMFDFVFFREQMCSLVCPYGRLQSALLDRDSLVVGYDRVRGEPRGKKKEREDACSGGCGCDGKGGCGSGSKCDGEHDHAPATPRRGDCVDCRMCVTTCPAGIDIRDGLQLECIHCTQCIDACDAVMTKLGRPTGLIRYSSQCTLEGIPRKRLRARLIVYPVLLTGLLVAAGYMLATRKDAAVAFLRIQGVPYAVKSAGLADETVESIVRMRIDNRTRAAKTYEVRGGDGVDLVRAESVEVAGDASREVDVVVRSAPRAFVRGHREVELVVTEQGGRDGAFREVVRAPVIGPLVIAPIGGTNP